MLKKKKSAATTSECKALTDRQVKQVSAKQAQARKDCIKNKAAVAPLVEAYEYRHGVRTLVAELLRCLPLHEDRWSELRALLPYRTVQVIRGGYHIYGLHGDLESTDYLPDAHPLIHLIDTDLGAAQAAVPQWYLCSFCGKPIRVKMAETTVASVLALTNCPNVTPHIRGSGWIVEALPLR